MPSRANSQASPRVLALKTCLCQGTKACCAPVLSEMVSSHFTSIWTSLLLRSAVNTSFMRRGTKIESFAHGEARYVKRKLLPWEGWMWEAQLSKVRTEVG